MNNFHRPYFSRSISEFWRRWHISLSTWFKDYLYIPLGGNRVKGLKKYVNLFITFAISGLWHGASWNYVVWGCLNGFYLVFAQVCNKQFQWMSEKLSFKGIGSVVNLGNQLLTFSLICLTWVFFRAEDIGSGISILNKIFSFQGSLFIGDNKNMIMSVLFLSLLVLVEYSEEYKIFNGFSLFNNSNMLIRRLSYLV